MSGLLKKMLTCMSGCSTLPREKLTKCQVFSRGGSAEAKRIFCRKAAKL